MKKKINKKKVSRSEAIYAIALAGISAAVALLLVWLGVVIRFSTIAFFVAAGIALMVPISKKYYLSAFFAYIASSALAFAIVGDIVAIVGYVAYFGPMSIFTAIIYDKKIKWYFAYPFKVLYINGALALMYFVCGTIMIDSKIIETLNYAIIAVVGTIALLVVDIVMQMVYKYIVPRVSRAIHSVTKSGKHKNGEQPRDGATYDDDTTNNASNNDGNNGDGNNNVNNNANNCDGNEFYGNSCDSDNEINTETNDGNNSDGKKTKKHSKKIKNDGIKINRDVINEKNCANNDDNNIDLDDDNPFA
ncbi:MAG: hypothetical protein RSB09_00590 [Clostridia bacterium]